MKKKGFTLIELLVVIAIMASILVLAITSLNGVSKAKKKEAKKKVEDQIELAAKQYVEANEYLFEDLKAGNNGSFKTVSIEKLIENDYLNVLTNPLTGKKYYKCNYVKVTKKSKNKYTFNFNESGDDCGELTHIESKEDGAPSINVYKDCVDEKGERDTTTKGEWCKHATQFTVTGSKGNGSPVTKIVASDNTDFSSSQEETVNSYTFEKAGDTSEKTIYFKVVNGTGKSSNVTSKTYKNDNTPPTINYIVNKKDDDQYSSDQNDISTTKVNTWINKKIDFSVKVTDGTSGVGTVDDGYLFKVKWNKEGQKITKDSYTLVNFDYVDQSDEKYKKFISCNNNICTYSNGGLYADGARYETYEACDNAGNCKTAPIYVNIDKTKPSCDFNATGTRGNTVGNVQWFIKDTLTVSPKVSDSLSGILSKALKEGENSVTNNEAVISDDTNINGRTFTVEVTDNAGNTNSCNKTYGLEKNVTLNFNSTKTNSSKSFNHKTFKKNNSSNGKIVFDSAKSTCGYGKCSNIKCMTDSGKKNQCPKVYFARSCEYVNTFLNYFNVTGASIGSNVEKYTFDSENDNKKFEEGLKTGNYNVNSVINTNLNAFKNNINGMSVSRWINRSNCRNSSNTNQAYYFEKCGSDSGQVDFSYRKYTYKSPAGNTSNAIELYTEFDIGCGYANYN